MDRKFQYKYLLKDIYFLLERVHGKAGRMVFSIDNEIVSIVTDFLSDLRPLKGSNSTIELLSLIKGAEPDRYRQSILKLKEKIKVLDRVL